MAFDSNAFRKSMARLVEEPGAQSTLNLLVAEREVIMAALVAGRKYAEIYRACKEHGMTVSYVSFCEAMRKFCDHANLTRTKRRDFLLIKQRKVLREALEAIIPSEQPMPTGVRRPVVPPFFPSIARSAVRRGNPTMPASVPPAKVGTESPLDTFREQMRTV